MTEPKEGDECPNCGLEYPGSDYDGESGFCVAPWQEKGDLGEVECLRRTHERLRSEVAALKDKLVAAGKVVEAAKWMRTHHGPHVAFDAALAELEKLQGKP